MIFRPRIFQVLVGEMEVSGNIPKGGGVPKWIGKGCHEANPLGETIGNVLQVEGKIREASDSTPAILLVFFLGGENNVKAREPFLFLSHLFFVYQKVGYPPWNWQQKPLNIFNQWLEDEIFISQKAYFQGRTVHFSACSCLVVYCFLRCSWLKSWLVNLSPPKGKPPYFEIRL